MRYNISEKTARQFVRFFGRLPISGSGQLQILMAGDEGLIDNQNLWSVKIGSYKVSDRTLKKLAKFPIGGHKDSKVVRLYLYYPFRAPNYKEQDMVGHIFDAFLAGVKARRGTKD